MRAFYLEKNVSFRLHLGFHGRDFPELSTTMRYECYNFGSDWSQMKGTFSWRRKYLHVGEFSVTSRFELSRLALETMEVWLRLVTK